MRVVMKRIAFVTCLAGLLAFFRVAAQQPGSLDTNYVTVAGTDFAPTVLAPMADGRLYVGGSFTSYGGTGRAAFARLKADGTVDTTFAAPVLRKIIPAVILNGQVLLPASTNAGSVTAALVLPDGRPVIVGSFSHVGATPAPGLAVLNLDGTTAATAFAVNKIEAGSLLAGPGGTFYVGGKGNVDNTRLPLLRFRPNGSTDAAFTPPTLAALGYASANPYVLRPGPGDAFYLVTAAAVGITPSSDIIRLTSSGALDTTFAGTGKASIPFSQFATFASDAQGRLTFTGVATYRGAALNRKINRLTVGGELDASYPVTVDPGFGGRVIAVQPDGKLLYTSTTVPINRLNANGTVDTAYANPAKVPVAQTAFSLTQFALAPDGSLFGAGFTLSPTFTPINGAFHIFGDPTGVPPSIAVEPVAQTNTLGARTRFFVIAQGPAPLSYQWFRGSTPINGATGTDLVLATTVAADDADYHCVVSNSLGSTPSATVHLTLLTATAGSVYRETDVAAGPNREVAELTLAGDGSLFAAGKFTTWNNTNRAGVVRLLPGSVEVDPAFVPNSQTGNANTPYTEVLPLPGGKAFVIGGFGYTVGAQRFGALRFNADGALDPTFLPHTGDTVLEGGIASGRPALGPDGKIVMWASIWNGENTLGSMIRIKPDGTRDTTFALRTASLAVAALPDGRYLVAGRNDAQPGFSAGVVRRNADGTPDLTFDSRSPLDSSFNATGDVNEILVLPDGRILVAGTFTYRANAPSPEVTLGLIRLLPNGRPDPTFNAVPALGRFADSSGGIRRIGLQTDGRIVGVALPRTGIFPRNQLVRFWPNGAVDPEFQVATNAVKNVNNALTSLAVRADNAILVGGLFNELSGFARTNFARINSGPLRPTPAPPTIASQPTRVIAKAGTSVTLTVVPGGDGPFQFQWRRSYTIGDTNLVDIPGANGASYTLASPRLQPQDSGLFQCAVVNPGGAVFTTLITLLVEPDPPVPGTRDTSFVGRDFHGILTSQPQVTDVAPGGLLYGSLGTTVVRLLEDGTRDVGFNPPADLVPAGGGVAVVKRQPDGKLLIAGRLKDGALARLLPDGSYDPDFVRTHNYTGFAQNVPWDIGLQSDGKILLAGTFDNFAGQPVTGLLRFLPDGTVDPSFPLTGIENLQVNPARVLPGTVVSLRVLPDDRIYIGGGFNRVRGVTRHGVARLNADGSLDATFVPPTNGAVASGTTGSMLFYTLGPVTPAEGVYLFGTFRPDLSVAADSALRLRPDGSIDGTFHVTTDFQINFGAVQADGKLIVTGQFTRLNGQPRTGYARLNGNGSTDASFTQGASFGVGAPMTILPDGKLLIGGTRYFTGGDVEVAAPEVGFTLTPGGLELTWPPGYQLQRTTSLSPANWQNVANPSPFTVPLGGPGEFFRVVPVP